MANNKDDKRGLASADEKTKKRVSSMGGRAHHEKRGQHGSDNS
jgi:hypothetical protein